MTTGTNSVAPGFTATLRQARALWVTGPGEAEIRAADLPPPGTGEVLVRAECSGVSRGTESLVWSGRVPPAVHDTMRAPFQEGDFGGPVKYGYLSVGVVEDGSPDLLGRTVFCLHPHQTSYVVPASAVSVVPDGVPPARAVLAGLVETAVNALWDAAPLVGDRVSVVGAGALGCCVARLVAAIPGVEVTLVDVDTSRAPVAEALGVRFSLPDDAPGQQDLVVHTSATSAGLRRSLELLRRDGNVVELSWYGDDETSVRLGDVFHSERLTVRGSQVGTVSPARAGSRTPAQRLALALRLLEDPAYDVLLTGSSTFDELPGSMAGILAGDPGGLMHVVHYSGGDDPGGAR